MDPVSLTHPLLEPQQIPLAIFHRMLLLLLACTSLLQAWAAPTAPGPQTVPTIAHSILWGIHSRTSGQAGLTERTLEQIIRSCLLTIAACVYRAIHQNIPDPKASWWKRQGIRMKITFYALITPEALIWWAIRQWLGAKGVTDKVNEIKPELKWTQTHGHFVQMGGFGRLDTERILHPPTLIKLLKNNQLDMAELKRVTQQRIEDHSKGDFLSKALLAVQTTWFIFECVARLAQELPLIELEVVTLAFATLNTLTYFFWWNKPLDVLCPIYLHILPTPETPLPPAPSDSESTPPSSPTPYTGSTETLLSTDEHQPKVGIVGRAVQSVCTAIHRNLWSSVDNVNSDIKHAGLGMTAWNRLILQPFVAVAGPLVELISDDNVHEEATHISIFYAAKIRGRQQSMLILLTCSIGMFFGVIHFLSWRAEFPTRIEGLLWRASSVALVVQPFFLIVSAYIHRLNTYAATGTRLHSLATFLILFIGFPSTFLGAIVYILARFCVLALALTTLRSIPPAAFETVTWTNYIPHL